MTRDVRFTDEAVRCVREISGWIGGRSPEGAIRWIDALDNARHQIAQRPESFSLAPEANQFAEPLHQALFKTRDGNIYRALFVVREKVIYVASVRGAGQGPVNPANVALPP